MTLAASNASIFGRVKAIAKGGGTYLFFSLLSRALPFFLLPVLTRYIDPEGYGIVAVVSVVIGIATPLIGMNSNSVLFQRYFKLDEASRADFLTDCYKIIVFNLLLACVLAFLFASFIEHWLKVSLGWFVLALISGAAGMITTLTTSLFQIRRQAFHFGIFQAVASLVNVCLTLLMVVAAGLAWQGRVWAITIAAVSLATVAIVMNFRAADISWRGMYSAGHVSSVCRLGGALIPSTISGWAIAMSDRLFLTSMTSMDVVGIYAIGVMVAQITDVFLNALGQAYLPHLYEKAHLRDINSQVKLVQGIYAIAVISICIPALNVFVGPYILQWLIDPRYHSAAQIIGWVSFSYAFFSIAAVFQGLLLVAEKNVLMIFVSIFTLIANLLGNYCLIGYYGMLGAAMANTLSALVFLLSLIAFSRHHTDLPWFDRRVFMLSEVRR